MTPLSDGENDDSIRARRSFPGGADGFAINVIRQPLCCFRFVFGFISVAFREWISLRLSAMLTMTARQKPLRCRRESVS